MASSGHGHTQEKKKLRATAPHAVCADKFIIGAVKAVQVALQHNVEPQALPRLVVVDVHVAPVHVTRHPDLIVAIRGENVTVVQASNGQPDPSEKTPGHTLGRHKAGSVQGRKAALEGKEHKFRVGLMVHVRLCYRCVI